MAVRNRNEELRRTIGAGLAAFQSWMADQFVPESPRVDWRILARTFLKVGTTGFGGGVAVIAQIRRLTVHQRRWLSDEEFLDAVSLAQSLPGANAVNAITYIGLKLAGIRGALISVASFILPSFLIMIGLTIAHTQFAELTDAKRIFLDAATVAAHLQALAGAPSALPSYVVLMQAALRLATVAGLPPAAAAAVEAALSRPC